MLRHAIALQNGGEYMAEHPVIAFAQPQHVGLFGGGAGQPPVCFYIGEIRYQVFRRYQVQLIQRAFPQLCGKGTAVPVHVGEELVIHIINAFGQQVPDGFVVQVKGGTVDPCRLTAFFHCYAGKILFPQKFQKRRIHFGAYSFASCSA